MQAGGRSVMEPISKIGQAMKRMTKYLVTVAAALGVAELCTFAVKNDFGLARNMETLINMMR